jgi:hypothetical protein
MRINPLLPGVEPLSGSKIPISFLLDAGIPAPPKDPAIF